MFVMICYADCPALSSLPTLPSNMACRIEPSCLEITCCVHVAPLSRSFSMEFIVDACNFTLIAAIENLRYEQSLIGYQFGK